MTNFAAVGERHAPLNRLFRQLKLSRKEFKTHQQLYSEIVFPDVSLRFANDFSVLQSEIEQKFPTETKQFQRLIQIIKEYDPFGTTTYCSTRGLISSIIKNPILVDMLLLPVMMYGNSEEHDMDFGQFVILFRSIFLEGLFRPKGTIKDFLDMLVAHYKSFGGELRFQAKVISLSLNKDKVTGLTLENGEEISSKAVISTIGIPGTAKLSGWPLEVKKYSGKMSFIESITILPKNEARKIKRDATIIFYNTSDRFSYCRPNEAVDISWGVVCLPNNFKGLPETNFLQVRVTNAANYEFWKNADKEQYKDLKEQWVKRSSEVAGKIIGKYWEKSVYRDSFTPKTIEYFTKKAAGAVYGSPVKIKNGKTPWKNLYIAGTDQGYLGIIGSMISGVSIVNQQLLI